MPYTRNQIAVHWIIFVLIVIQFLLHEPMVSAWEVVEDGGTPEKTLLVMSHVVGGVLILAFAIWRVVLRLRHGAPALPKEEKPLMKAAAHLTHFGLYALLILMPLSGMAAWFGGIMPAAETHEVMKFLMLALVALHIAGALYHQFVLKNNLINRMKRAGTPK